MVVWLDGRTNTRARPQENFGREIMELFTFGVGNYTEQDVYAAARVFTGWNLRIVDAAGEPRIPTTYYEFVYNANQHDTTAKTFTFPIYGDGEQTIPARAGGRRHAGRHRLHHRAGASSRDRAASGAEAVELLRQRAGGRRIRRSSTAVAGEYLRNDTEMKPVVQFILRSAWFLDPPSWYARYSWPVEFVVRAIREVGWDGFSIDTARTPLTNMGQTLFEPPDVNGWELGPGWFSTGAMLSRMNFAVDAGGQSAIQSRRAPRRRIAVAPEDVLDFFLDRLSPAPFEQRAVRRAARLPDVRRRVDRDPTRSSTPRPPGWRKLIVGSSEYQFV